jgi:hypothetical protein
MMRRAALISALCLMLAGCDFFSSAPHLPPLPEGSETVAGDGAWEVPYDQATIAWHDRFEPERPFRSTDVWLKRPVSMEEILKRYDTALADWEQKDDKDARGRWQGRIYRKGGRVVGVAIFDTKKYGATYDVLQVLSGPVRWYDPDEPNG